MNFWWHLSYKMYGNRNFQNANLDLHGRRSDPGLDFQSKSERDYLLSIRGRQAMDARWKCRNAVWTMCATPSTWAQFSNILPCLGCLGKLESGHRPDQIGAQDVPAFCQLSISSSVALELLCAVET